MTDEATLAHYGTPQHSGRYPWGSGDDPYQSGVGFLSMYDELKKQGLSEAKISEAMGFDSTSELRARRSRSSNDVRAEKARQLTKLLDKGMGMSAATRQMGIPESTGRSLMDPIIQQRAQRFRVTADILKNAVDEHKYVDVGRGTENHLGVSDTQLKTAIALLKDEGYILRYTNVPQAGTGLNTSLKVLTKLETTAKEVYHNRDKIHFITDHVDPDSGEIVSLKPPVNIKSKRVGVIYGPDGGADADGVMFIRPGVPDVSLGNAQYAQVRVAVDGTHYIKGMAMYKDNLPAGVDIMFNTNKKDTGNKLDALKKQDDKDPLNPFGSMTRQKTYVDPKTGKTEQSVLNIVNEEGDWYNWSNKFSSQFLSKQTPQLAKEQLTLTTNAKKADLEDILALTNPGVKRKLLETFADEADSSAVNLKAVGLPRTATHVILPINSLKDTEIYAPKYNDGEVVTLVRHPHGGIFEIPQLTVNNSNKEAARSIKGAKDAVGINAKVAERLSGADFDGDTVLVIPNNSGKVKVKPALDALKNWNPKDLYTLPDDSTKGFKGAKNPGVLKQSLMGDVSNLITDMTLKGANDNEIARAVKHSMVVIDAEKHNLDYKQSAIDQNINDLKRKYQGSAKAGASTLISRTTSDKKVDVKKPRPAALGGPIDPKTGEKVYLKPGDSWTNSKGQLIVFEPESYVDKQGKTKIKQEKSTKGAEAKDAHSLSSGTVIEEIYANHANALKLLANQARKEALSIQNIPYDKSAKAAYDHEVKSLNAKLFIAKKQAPLERQAQLLAQQIIKAKVEANPHMEKADLKKVTGQAIAEARIRLGSPKKKIQIEDEEWNAIQSGAISAAKLKEIIDNTDVDQLRTRATPRSRPTMNASNVALAQGMLAQGYTVAQISERLGVSTSTLYSVLD